VKLSVNTVKTHQRHLYQKLGARSRTQAVGQARALGLLASSPRGSDPKPDRHVPKSRAISDLASLTELASLPGSVAVLQRGLLRIRHL
jgi:regulatory LuxR family protein